VKLDKKTRHIENVRVAFNRVGGKIPERAKNTERKLGGKTLTRELMDDAIASLRNELRLSSDFRVSGEYRSDVACVLFKRALGRCYETLTGEKLG
jgi:CO/xanthine dehydrogenase FAD-binding subunit